MSNHFCTRGRIRWMILPLVCALALVATACAADDDSESDSESMAAVESAAGAAQAAQAEAGTARAEAGSAMGEAQAARAEASAAESEAAAANAAAEAAAALAETAIAAAELAQATAAGNQAAVAAAEAALEAAQAAASAAQAEAASAQAEAAGAQAEAAEARNAAVAAAADAAAAAAAEATAAEAAATEMTDDEMTAADGLPAFGTAERCEANRAAGKLVFMTGFDFAAASGIIEVITAEDEGFFDDMCLDVEIQPGFAPGNSAAMAAGTVQLGATATFGELVTQNIRGDADLVAFAQMGHTAISQLLINPDSGVDNLSDLAGKTMGIKGDIPIAIQAMIAKEGLVRGTFTELLLDGFNPIDHFSLGIDALPVYRSNEPRTLDNAGVDYITYDPLDYDVPASFAIFTTTRSFYDKHPTVTEDFVRAALRGFYYALENPTEAIDNAFTRIEAAGNNLYFAREHETFRMTTDQQIIQDVTPQNLEIGQLNVPRLGDEIQNLVNLGVYEYLPDWRSMLDDTVVQKLYDGDELVWASMR